MDAIGLEYNASSSGSSTLINTVKISASSSYLDSLIMEIGKKWPDFYTSCIKGIYIIYIKTLTLSISEYKNASCSVQLQSGNHYSNTIMSASRNNNVLSITDPYNIQTNGFWVLPGFDIFANVYNSYTSVSFNCEIYMVNF